MKNLGAVVPHIDNNTKTWWIGTNDLGMPATGPAGPKGDPGEDVNIEEAAPTFVEAEELSNINSGETVPTLFGKIKKALSTLFNFGVVAEDDLAVEAAELRDADMLGGQYSAADITKITSDVNQINSNLTNKSNKNWTLLYDSGYINWIEWKTITIPNFGSYSEILFVPQWYSNPCGSIILPVHSFQERNSSNNLLIMTPTGHELKVYYVSDTEIAIYDNVGTYDRLEIFIR